MNQESHPRSMQFKHRVSLSSRPRGRIMRLAFRATAITLGFMLGVAIALSVHLSANAADPNTYNSSGPHCTASPGSSGFPGTLPGQPFPLWCYGNLNLGGETQVEGPNSWVDDFNHGLTFGECCPGYVTFDDSADRGIQSVHWRHNNHWMVDIAPQGSAVGGSFMRPDRTFSSQNGTAVIEVDVSAGINGYGPDAWTEIGFTQASTSTTNNVDALYAYGQFGGYWTVGCRLQPGGTQGAMTCAVESSQNNVSGNDTPPCFSVPPARVMEISWFQQCGNQHYSLDSGSGAPFSHCTTQDPDLVCRMRFRMEVTKTSLSVYIQKLDSTGAPTGPMQLYLKDAGWDSAHQLPDSFINGQFYAYAADWQVRSDADVVRFHWDRFAVNPDAQPEPADEYAVTWGSQSTPGSMAAGSTSPVTLSLTNAGTATWNNSGGSPVRVSYHWKNGTCPGTATAVWDGVRTNLPSNVAADAAVNGLQASVKAPNSPGSYCLQFDLVKEGVTWFSTQGANLLTKSVNVTGGGSGGYGVIWISDNTPSSMTGGSLSSVSLSFTNSGAQAWPSGGGNPVRLSYHWRNGTCPGTTAAVWDGIRTILSSDVAAGGNVNNLTASVRAPATAGTYCLQFDLVKEGLTWFSSQGVATRNKTVIVAGSLYSVNWTSGTAPSSIAANSTISVPLSFTNTAAQAWPSGGGNPVRVSYHWKSGACPGTSTSVWDGLRTSLNGNVPTSGNVTNLSTSVKAPALPGTYCLQFDLVQEGLTWFSTQGGAMRTQTITVN